MLAEKARQQEKQVIRRVIALPVKMLVGYRIEISTWAGDLTCTSIRSAMVSLECRRSLDGNHMGRCAWQQREQGER